MQQRDHRRGHHQHQGTTNLDMQDPNRGSDPKELPRVQGEVGGGLSRDLIKCRTCYY